MKNTVPNFSMDLRGTLCPINYVKTKLKLETMEIGQVLEIFVDAGEPIENLPKSVEEDGNKILLIEEEKNTFRLLIEKRV